MTTTPGSGPPDPYRVQLDLIRQQGGAHFVDRLERARESRTRRLLELSTRLRPVLPGLDQVLAHLEQIEASFTNAPGLDVIAFLVSRVRGDVELSIEALLSGAGSIINDSMRDLMEIEFLLRDFARDHARIRAWLSADDRTRGRLFGPAAERAREAVAISPGLAVDLPDDAEYMAHCQSLHPTPYPAGKGIDEHADLLALLLPVGEILEHARRVFDAFDELLESFDVRPRPARWRELTLMAEAWTLWSEEMRRLAPSLPPRMPTPSLRPNRAQRRAAQRSHGR